MKKARMAIVIFGLVLGLKLLFGGMETSAAENNEIQVGSAEQTVNSTGSTSSESAGVSWSWNAGTNTLTISFVTNSVIPDYKVGEERPWESYISSIQKIKISDGVTVIGDNAFSGCTSLKSVEFSGTKLKEIGNRAFYECSSLEQVTLPSSVEQMGYYAFYGCSALKSADISATKITDLKTYAFGYCSLLSNMKLPDKLQEIEDYCFSGDKSLQTLQMPAALKTVGRCAFSECRILSSLDFESTELKEVGDYAFYYCASLKNCIFPKTVKTLGSYLFQGCLQLEYIKILSTDVQFGDDICSDCGSEAISIYAYESNTNVCSYISSNSDLAFVNLYYFSASNVQVTLGDISAYTGKEIKPSVSINYVPLNKTLVKDQDYEITYKNNINAGKATIVIKGIGRYDGSFSKEFTISQAKTTLTAKDVKSSYELLQGKTMTIKASSSGDEGVRYVSSNKAVATVDSSGKVKAVGCGSAKITIYANKETSSNYVTASKQISVKVGKEQKITTKTLKKSYTYGDAGFSLGVKVKGDAKVSYSSSNKNVVTVKNGKVTIVGAGTAKITITTKEKNYYYPASKTVSITVNPQKVKVTPKQLDNTGNFELKYSNLTPNTKLEVKLQDASGKTLSTTTIKVGKKKTVSDVHTVKLGKEYKFVITAVYTDSKTGKALKSSQSSVKVSAN